MEMLRGKTPDMVRKEIYVHLMAYNLLRTVMWQAGFQSWSLAGTHFFARHSLTFGTLLP
jgi:hypothetical protein